MGSTQNRQLVRHALVVVAVLAVRCRRRCLQLTWRSFRLFFRGQEQARAGHAFINEDWGTWGCGSFTSINVPRYAYIWLSAMISSHILSPHGLYQTACLYSVVIRHPRHYHSIGESATKRSGGLNQAIVVSSSVQADPWISARLRYDTPAVLSSNCKKVFHIRVFAHPHVIQVLKVLAFI